MRLLLGASTRFDSIGGVRHRFDRFDLRLDSIGTRFFVSLGTSVALSGTSPACQRAAAGPSPPALCARDRHGEAQPLDPQRPGGPHLLLRPVRRPPVCRRGGRRPNSRPGGCDTVTAGTKLGLPQGVRQLRQCDGCVLPLRPWPWRDPQRLRRRPPLTRCPRAHAHRRTGARTCSPTRARTPSAPQSPSG